MTERKRWTIFIALFAACLFAVCAFMPALSAGGEVAHAAGDADALTAGTYGNIDTDTDLWYFAEGELDLPAVREYVKNSVLPVLEANDADPVVIAVIDTGLDLGNSVFGNVLMRGEDNTLLGYNSFYASRGETDKVSNFNDESADLHGTAMASVIATLIEETGLSDYIKIYPIKASYPKEYVDSAADGAVTVNAFDRTTVRVGIERAVEIGAEVINLSLCSTTDSESEWRTDKDMQAAIEVASQSATIVAAAGNNGTASSSHYFYPAAYNGVIGVMSHDSEGYHSTTNYGSAYDIFAPGTGVMVSTEDGVYRTTGSATSGTSVAAPFVSFASALLRLSLKAEELADDAFTMPRNAVINRMITNFAEDDASVTAKDGAAYKKLDILKLISEDILDIDYGWAPVTGITAVATMNGKTVTTGSEITVQTLRETGKGRSYLEFSAVTSPAGDTDPSVADRVEWTLTEYEDEDKEEEVSSEVIGRGRSIGHLFDHAGYYVLRASLEVAEGAEPLTAELAFTVVAPAWKGSEAFIVPEEYLSSAAYIKGEDGAVSQETDLYGAGATMTFGVTTLEDVEYESVYWYVDGTIAGTGRMFTYSPSGLPSGDHKITVRVTFENDTTAYVSSVFIVHHKSWAAHPLFAILWTALGIGVIAAVVIVVKKSARKKAPAEAASEEGDDRQSPIRKQ